MATSQAATVSHDVQFIIAGTYGSVTGSQQVFSDTFLTASVPAFDSTLGTLESFSITWFLSGSFSGTLSTGGGASSGYNGPYLIDGTESPGIVSATGGGGNGGGGGPGTVVNLPLTAPSNPTSFTQTFSVAAVGTYPQAVLDAVTGTDPVALRWNTPLIINGDFSALTVTGNASATISYNYVPEASSFAFSFIALGSACIRRKRR